MLHVVRERGLADTANQQCIRHYAERYPNAQFILAHAARGFNPYHVAAGIRSLCGLRNIWFDTSAVTEGSAFEVIIRTLGADRLFYGSDFPVTHIRGRCVALGDSFIWLSPKNINMTVEYGEIRPTLVGIESLRALKLACANLQLSDSVLEGIFRHNVMKLLGIAT
jgi:glutamate-1-semialdehyde 2,1-aminomutase